MSCLKKLWRFVKQNSSVIIFFIIIIFKVLMLISYNHFYMTNLTITLCFADVSVSANSNNGPSINIYDKNFSFMIKNFSFCKSSRF